MATCSWSGYEIQTSCCQGTLHQDKDYKCYQFIWCCKKEHAWVLPTFELRSTLVCLTILANNCIWILEQPHQSLVGRWSRFEWMVNHVAYVTSANFSRAAGGVRCFWSFWGAQKKQITSPQRKHHAWFWGLKWFDKIQSTLFGASYFTTTFWDSKSFQVFNPETLLGLQKPRIATPRCTEWSFGWPCMEAPARRGHAYGVTCPRYLV